MKELNYKNLPGLQSEHFTMILHLEETFLSTRHPVSQQEFRP